MVNVKSCEFEFYQVQNELCGSHIGNLFVRQEGPLGDFLNSGDRQGAFGMLKVKSIKFR